MSPRLQSEIYWKISTFKANIMPRVHAYTSLIIPHRNQISSYLSARIYTHTRRGCKCHPPCITKFICVLASGKSCMWVRAYQQRRRDDARRAQFHSLTQLNIMPHISRKHSERKIMIWLFRVILRAVCEGWILHFCRRTYVFPYFIDVQRRSAGVLCINWPSLVSAQPVGRAEWSARAVFLTKATKHSWAANLCSFGPIK